MAITQGMTMPVTLICGQITAGLGEVTLPVQVTSAASDGVVLPVAIEADMPAFRTNLAALLREAADTIERGDFDGS